MLLARFLHISSLRTLRSLDDLKLDRISFLQRAVAVASDRGIMYENIGAIVAPDEAVTFCVIEPFYCSVQAYSSRNKCFSCWLAANSSRARASVNENMLIFVLNYDEAIDKLQEREALAKIGHRGASCPSVSPPHKIHLSMTRKRGIRFMHARNKRRWRDLCEEAEVETDPRKFRKLAKQISRILEDEQKRANNLRNRSKLTMFQSRRRKSVHGILAKPR
jgi:hypothetical protein